MSAPKFTPGPWKAEFGDPEDGFKGIGAVVMPAHGEANKSFAICQCLGPDSVANAQLIAAAPDMYTALEMAHDAFHSQKSHSPQDAA